MVGRIGEGWKPVLGTVFPINFQMKWFALNSKWHKTNVSKHLLFGKSNHPLSKVDFIKVGRMAQSAECNCAQRLAQNERKAQVRLAWNINLFVFHNKNMKGRCYLEIFTNLKSVVQISIPILWCNNTPNFWLLISFSGAEREAQKWRA